jgi:hypothetical protein
MLGSQPVPTVRVKSDHPEHDQGFVVINQSDFDQSIHQLWGGTKAFDPIDPYPVAASNRLEKINTPAAAKPARRKAAVTEARLVHDADT